MTSRQSQLETPPSLELTAHLGHVRSGLLISDPGSRGLNFVAYFGRHLDSRRSGTSPAPPGISHEQRRLGERGSGDDVYAAGQARLDRAFFGDHYSPDAAARKSRHHRQKTRDGAQLATERKLAEDRPTTARSNLLGPDENTQRHRKIQGCAALAHIRRRQIDRDPARWVVVAAVPDRPANSLAGLLKGRVCKTHDCEAGQSGCHVHFNPDWTSIQAVEGGRQKRGEHDATVSPADHLRLT